MYTHEERKILRETPPFDNRNIADEFKNMSTEAIKSEMISRSKPMIVILENLVGDFNISSVVRSANAFAMRSVYICGRKQWDRRGAVGTHHYINVHHAPDTISVIKGVRSAGYKVVAAELTEDAIALPNYNWDSHTAVVFGEEGRGISPEVLDSVDEVVYVPQFGTVRSMNVATVAGMFMYDYRMKNT